MSCSHQGTVYFNGYRILLNSSNSRQYVSAGTQNFLTVVIQKQCIQWVNVIPKLECFHSVFQWVHSIFLFQYLEGICTSINEYTVFLNYSIYMQYFRCKHSISKFQHLARVCFDGKTVSMNYNVYIEFVSMGAQYF